MDVLLLLLLAALLIGGAALTLAHRRRALRERHALQAERDRARAAAAAAIRTLRLAAIELRGPATTLLGHADRLRAEGANSGATIRAIVGRVLDLADDLQHHALGDASGRVLHAEPAQLAPLLADAVAAVDASLGPSRRHWRLPADSETVELIVDRRAMAQILARVLGNAARFSRHDDWIDISFEVSKDRFSLIVADEGDGAAAEGAGVAGQADSRGLGLGLALARVLTEAHGGELAIEATPSVGTLVALRFPVERLVRRVVSEAV